MGFMDKLNDAGKSALKGTLAAAATSYGTVISGKHQLCKIGMNSGYDTLIFIKVAAIEEQCVIKESVKTFALNSEDIMAGKHYIDLIFQDGEKAKVQLTVDQQKGSALPTAEQRIAAQYGNTAKFVEGLAKNVPEISENTKQWVNQIMRFANRPEIF
ncbi:MAG: hypothetical protein KHW87_04225 [Clostridiales bacterium]|nr:hypothetical protein [Clostridiales bacterium]